MEHHSSQAVVAVFGSFVLFAAKRSATAAAKKKRGYSREFPIRTDTRLKIDIDWVPPTLYKALRSKATRVGVSLRALTLRLWKEWVDRDEP